MAVLTTGNTFSNGDQVTASSLNNAVNDAEFAAGAVDGISTQRSGGAIIVKDLGISSGKIAIDAVGTDQLANDVVISTSGSITGAAGSFTTLSASGDISVDGSVKQSGNVGNLTIKGGDTDGANIELYGASHASEANKAFYDASTHSFRPEDGSSSRVVISSSGLTASGDLTVDTTTLKVDSTNNRVGIGTTTPQHKLDIRAESDAAISTGLLIANTASSSEGTGTAIRMVHSTSQTSNSASTISSERAASNGSIIGLNLSTDGSAVPSRVMTLLGANGNVGIGTVTPNAKLQIKTSASEVEGISVLNAGNTSEIFKVIEDGSNGGYVDIRNSSNTSIIRLNSSGDSYFNADNVGIGTASPSNTLHVENTTSSGAYINYDGQSNTEFGLKIESNAAGGDFESDFANGSTALLDLYANSASVSGGDLLVARTQSATPVMLVKGNGNVGIGTTSPTQLLDVNGQARVVGNLFVGTDDTTPNGMIEVYGAGGVEKEGGEIRLRTAAEYDTTYNHYFIDAYEDDLRIGREGAADITLTSDGNVGIGTTTPSAPLTVTSTTGGVLMPRMTTTQMNAISSPTNGEMIYNTTDNKFYGYANGAWVALH